MAGRRYAEGTTVTIEKSRQELEHLFRRYDAERFVQAQQPEGSIVQVELRGRWYQFTVKTPVREWNSSTASLDKEHRRRWRVLVLLIKAKLEATADEDEEALHREFLPYLLLPNGGTFAEASAPQIERMYEIGASPDPLAKFLPLPPEDHELEDDSAAEE